MSDDEFLEIEIEDEEPYDIILANVGFSLLQARPTSKGDFEYRSSPIIAWMITHHALPITVDTVEWQYRAIRFPDGKVYSYEDGEPIYDHETAWKRAVMDAHKNRGNLIRPDFTKKKGK